MRGPDQQYARKRDRALRSGFVGGALLLTACSPGPDTGDHGTRPDARAEAPGTEAPVCLAGGPFVAAGPIQVRATEPADGDRVGALRWQSHDGCERFVIDLVAADDSPADHAGSVTAELMRDLGLLRISLHDIEGVDPDATDASFDGSLAGTAYAVRPAGGAGIDVDVHLAAAAEAHVTTLDAPARVVIDLRPGGAPLPEPAPRSTRVVVLQPRSGAAAYPLTVTGYARTFEANVAIRIEQDGRDVDERFTTATGWLDAWGAWSFSVEDGPVGRVVIHVGEYSARDGAWQGVAIPLDMR